VKPDEITALAADLGECLKAQALTAVVAESCTGGGIAEAITRISGSSWWFDRGFVTYSNQAKQDMLGVPAPLLAAHGAVSEEAARAMLEGALARSGAGIGASVTGIAGPDGGTAEKPVGLVCFAWGFAKEDAIVESRQFGGDREGVRRQAVAYALRGLLELVRTRG
jgi:nicotinamide-nucleotide amidase